MKEDLRVQKTKAALHRAFYDLLAEKSYDDITVNELCERAMVRRATFYKHYRDKQDFLVSMIKKFNNDFYSIVWKESRPTPPYDYFIKYCDTLIAYLDKYSATVKNILRGPMREPFFNVILRQNYIDATEKLNTAINGGYPLRTSVEVTASMIVGGITFLMLEWFENDQHIPKEQLRLDLAVIIESALAPEKV